jgi:hypothetical protein
MLALLPVYMAVMLLASIAGLIICVIGFIPMMIRPQLAGPIRDRIMTQFSQMMAQMAVKQMMRGRQ